MVRDKFILKSFSTIKVWIASHVHLGIKSADVVAISGYSRSYFLREFELATGMTLANYIRQERLKRSLQQLEETDMRIKEISHSLGYPSQSTFCQIFKNQYRVSPSEYRLLCRRTACLAS
ncbi:AraC family transcriptional regulator [Edwardsiella hoshinae]|uniref:AraC family transcriptional regulator n=1 Tax=Edwardsiella hoshinae TaxID=93378 RepID=A0A376DFS8_9GAMM|nr:helix-turn-helix transcriptional regulator [Edwardsiella hoshinae]AOV96953.1 AraC family transcriptional regulator [Edwardsiella hoshinae]QPR27192.1 helix-turn-helix transcriptional regulator [Edwardsiella hoshinae]STC88181.1 Regulatory protein soxS [Edwardsiella hoshinae]